MLNQGIAHDAVEEVLRDLAARARPDAPPVRIAVIGGDGARVEREQWPPWCEVVHFGGGADYGKILTALQSGRYGLSVILNRWCDADARRAARKHDSKVPVRYWNAGPTELARLMVAIAPDEPAKPAPLRANIGERVLQLPAPVGLEPVLPEVLAEAKVAECEWNTEEHEALILACDSCGGDPIKLISDFEALQPKGRRQRSARAISERLRILIVGGRVKDPGRIYRKLVTLESARPSTRKPRRGEPDPKIIAAVSAPPPEPDRAPVAGVPVSPPMRPDAALLRRVAYVLDGVDLGVKSAEEAVAELRRIVDAERKVLP